MIRAKRTFTFEATFTPASSLPPDQDTLSHCFLGHSFITVVSPLVSGGGGGSGGGSESDGGDGGSYDDDFHKERLFFYCLFP